VQTRRASVSACCAAFLGHVGYVVNPEKPRRILFRKPIAVLLASILGNIAAFFVAGIAQTIHVVADGQFSDEGFWIEVSYSFGAGIFIIFVAFPASLLLLAIASALVRTVQYWHVVLAAAVGVCLGLSSWGSYYWGVPVFFYVATAATVSALVLRARTSLV